MWGLPASSIGAVVASIGEASGLLGSDAGVGVAEQEEAATIAASQAGGWPEPLPGLKSPPPPVAVVGALPGYAVTAGVAWIDAWFRSYASEYIRRVAGAQRPPWGVS